MDKKQERIALLERQIQRARARVKRLEALSSRYSWVRVGIFFGGLGLALLVAIPTTWWIGVLLAIMTLLIFAVVAHFHGKIERSIARHNAWIYIQFTHVARMKLDWEHIPTADSGSVQDEHPFESDLDITGPHSLHRLLNTAVSQEGSLRLRDWLLNTKPDLSTIEYRQALVRELAPMTRFRNRLTMHALLASRRISEQLEGRRLLRWLAQESQPATELLPLLGLSIILNVLTPLLFVLSLFGIIPSLWYFSLLAVWLLFFGTAKQRGDIFSDASYLSSSLGTLSRIFNYLQTYPYGKHERVKRLCAPFYEEREHTPVRLLQRTARIADAATLRNNALIWLIVNSFLPWDIFCAYRLRQCKEQIARRLPDWLDTWFELEALCSLAAFAYLNPEYTQPAISMDQESSGGQVFFRARALGHPLIPVEKKVTNDFTLQKGGEVVIITGSNIAGKSTFLRTLGVNLCLAYVGAPVNADRLETCLFRLFSCIRVSDSVTGGYSYFYAEVKRLRALLSELERAGYPLFFLIDEIFKGTNNRERLIGSRSYVRALVGRNCLGVISTHDLELVKLADVLPQVKNYHFREEVVEGEMSFDYRLRPGPCPTTNALKIMQMEGLPVEIAP
ncbi:MAG: hypothetical protein IMW89_15985 [Ktedonobacteraceae bacterium]|nr:hypothetical protein [Ktedonobacteraceae bacterium]